jgi:hypothetical protein
MWPESDVIRAQPSQPLLPASLLLSFVDLARTNVLPLVASLRLLQSTSLSVCLPFTSH